MVARADEAVPEVRKPRPAAARLPGEHGWRVLGWEAADYMCQLEALLSEPSMQALLAERAGLARIVRPIGRMLGVGPKLVLKAVKRAAKRVRPEPLRGAGFDAKPRRTRATWWQPKLSWSKT